MSVSELREWRRPRREVAWALVAFSVAYSVLMGVLLNHVGVDSSDVAKVLVVAAMLVFVLVSGTLAYRVFGHARVTATTDGVVVANPFRGDQFVAWDDLASMKADRLLLIYRRNGQRVIAWAIQKNGWARARHVRTDADEAIDELNRFAESSLRSHVASS